MSEVTESTESALDALGLRINLAEGEHIVQAMIICKIHNFDSGVTSLGVFPSKSLDWIDKYGLLAAAREATRPDLESG